MEINFKDEKSKQLFQKNSKKINTKNKKQSKKINLKDSYNINYTQIPKDTREILKNFNPKEFDNFNLKLNKYGRFDITDKKRPKDKKFIFYRKGAKELDDIEIKVNFGKFDFEENIKKQENYIKAIFKENIQSFLFKIYYRLLIGAEKSIYETSIRLHHIYGIPFIPSSAIKGVVRSYIELEDKLGTWIDYFGSEEKEGKIVFFDAFPTTKPKIKVDVMTPHYNHYYNEGEAPTDDHNPVPINFLTVEDTKFNFFIASKEQIEQEFIDLFKKALTEHGIGAKTAVGYGYFEE